MWWMGAVRGVLVAGWDVEGESWIRGGLEAVDGVFVGWVCEAWDVW